MAVEGVSNSTQTNAFGSVEKKDQLGSSQFMQLMIAQLKNQDPTKPMDPSQFLGQLAQFSTVSGIQDMQGSLSSLSDALRSSQVLGGTSMVGREVLVDADEAPLGTSGSVSGSTDVPKSATAVALVVTDSSGQLVRRMPLSTQEGEVSFAWDGTTDQGARADPGNYTISAIASVGGANEQLPTRLATKVGSVSIDSATQALTLNTSIGPIELSRVRRVM